MERLPTPVFWPGEFHGPYSQWGRKESDETDRLSLSLLLDLERCKQDYLPEKVSIFHFVLELIRNLFLPFIKIFSCGLVWGSG